MRTFFFLFSISVICSFANAAIYTTISNGPWSAAATWSGGSIPPNTIPNGDVVNVNHNVTHNANIVIRGTLNIASGRTLNLSGRDIDFPTNGQGLLVNSGTLLFKKMTIEPGGGACANGALPRVNNSGTMTGSEEINVGNGDGCGSLFNTGQITVPKLHNDGYICNSLTIRATTEFDFHGGTMECCGNLITPLIKFHKNGSRPATSTCQNFCTGSAYSGGVAPTLTDGAAGYNTITNPGLSNSEAVITVPGTTWCSFAALPIELVSFSLNPISSRELELTWKTASEKDNDYFSIERSESGEVWEAIGQVAGAGNSTQLLEYSYSDLNPQIGVYYYRLKQTDYNGESNYSEVLSYNLESSESGLIALYPNPVENKLTVNLQTSSEFGILTIESLNGKAIYEEKISGSGIHKIYVDMESLSKGMYFVKFNDGESYIVKSLVKN